MTRNLTQNFASESEKSNAWLSSFMDLILIMITFFILMFALNSKDLEGQTGMIESLRGKFNVFRSKNSPQASLYLIHKVVLQALDANEIMYTTRVRVNQDNIGIELPYKVLFDESNDLTALAEKLISAIAMIQFNFHDKIIEVNSVWEYNIQQNIIARFDLQSIVKLLNENSLRFYQQLLDGGINTDMIRMQHYLIQKENLFINYENQVRNNVMDHSKLQINIFH